MSKRQKPTLDEFMETRPLPTRCSVCLHPDRDHIDGGLRKGYPAAAIADWSRKHSSLPLSDDSLLKHKRKHLQEVNNDGA